MALYYYILGGGAFFCLGGGSIRGIHTCMLILLRVSIRVMGLRLGLLYKHIMTSYAHIWSFFTPSSRPIRLQERWLLTISFLLLLGESPSIQL